MIDKTSKRFVFAVADYIAGVCDPVRRISIEQAASLAGCSPWTMNQHLKKIKAPMHPKAPPRKLYKQWQAPEGTWKPRQ